jgi:recombination protein RecA
MAAEKKLGKSSDEVLKELEKQYGKGAVLHGKKSTEELDVIDTGSIGLNHALGIGGIAKGKVYEMFGWESSGKSTLCQTIVGNFQKKGIKCIYVDGENSVDRKYAEALGMDVDGLFTIQLDEYAGEGAYNKVEKLVETGEFGLVVIDSYNSLQPLAVLQGETGDSAIGKHARMQGQFVMKANYLSTKYNCTFIFVGQLREKIGVMYGSPQTTQGGNALKFYTHGRMEIVRSVTKDNSVMNGDVKLGNKVTIKVIKNKMGAPFTQCELNVLYGIGFDKFQEIIDLGKETDVLKVRAGVITYKENKHTEQEFRELLITNPEFLEEIRSAILIKLDNIETVSNEQVEV